MAAVNNDHETTLTHQATFGLGELRIRHPAGTFPVTPASLISLQAIGTQKHLLSGMGIDWGSGSGVLSIAASRIDAVSKVYGLDIVDQNVNSARENARTNEAETKTVFYRSDSFVPFDQSDRDAVDSLRGAVQFVLANPPSSEGDDGFDFRRRILREAREFLVSGGVVLLSISTQYGTERIQGLTTEAPGFRHGGELATTNWVPFDLTRPDLLDCLKNYASEEQRGGVEYEFRRPQDESHNVINAQTALLEHEQTGQSPLSRWQTHLFSYR